MQKLRLFCSDEWMLVSFWGWQKKLSQKALHSESHCPLPFQRNNSKRTALILYFKWLQVSLHSEEQVSRVQDRHDRVSAFSKAGWLWIQSLGKLAAHLFYKELLAHCHTSVQPFLVFLQHLLLFINLPSQITVGLKRKYTRSVKTKYRLSMFKAALKKPSHVSPWKVLYSAGSREQVREKQISSQLVAKIKDHVNTLSIVCIWSHYQSIWAPLNTVGGREGISYFTGRELRQRDIGHGYTRVYSGAAAPL